MKYKSNLWVLVKMQTGEYETEPEKVSEQIRLFKVFLKM